MKATVIAGDGSGNLSWSDVPSLPAVTYATAPRAFTIRIAAVPTPLAPAWISTRSPVARLASCTMLTNAV